MTKRATLDIRIEDCLIVIQINYNLNFKKYPPSFIKLIDFIFIEISLAGSLVRSWNRYSTTNSSKPVLGSGLLLKDIPSSSPITTSAVIPTLDPVFKCPPNVFP